MEVISSVTHFSNIPIVAPIICGPRLEYKYANQTHLIPQTRENYREFEKKFSNNERV